jgi:protoporphyrinogen IX oxidase
MEWLKVIHLLCVMGWMTGFFAVPRALIYWKREYAKDQAFGPTGDLTIRIYRFSLGLGVIAFGTGLWLAQDWGWPVWSQWKLSFVVLLAFHYAWTGRLVLRARRGVFSESDFFLRVFNEVSVIGAIIVLILVVYKPFG